MIGAGLGTGLVRRDIRFRSTWKRVFMDFTAGWTGDIGVQFHQLFVVVAHPFQEGCKRGTAVVAEVVSVLVGHGCSLRVDAKPGRMTQVPRFRRYCTAVNFWLSDIATSTSRKTPDPMLKQAKRDGKANSSVCSSCMCEL